MIILIIVAVNAVLSISQEDHAQQALAELKKMSSPQALALRDGKPRKLPAAELVPGDVIQLGHANDDYYHTLLVTRTGLFPGVNNIAVATHTFDAYMRPLNTYEAEKMRFLHVKDA